MFVMLERSLGQIRLLLLIPIKLPDAINLLIGGVAAFLLAFLLTFFVKAICYKVGWLDKPAARRVHTKAVPRLGGVAIYVAFVIASLFFLYSWSKPQCACQRTHNLLVTD